MSQSPWITKKTVLKLTGLKEDAFASWIKVHGIKKKKDINGVTYYLRNSIDEKLGKESESENRNWYTEYLRLKASAVDSETTWRTRNTRVREVSARMATTIDKLVEQRDGLIWSIVIYIALRLLAIFIFKINGILLPL